MQNLIDSLNQAGKPPVQAVFPDGTQVLVLPAGARLLGLYPSGSTTNFLWTNPALEEAESAKDWFAQAAWPNPGGDRTWLAPEYELFITDLARPWETYQVPAALDPGNWTLAAHSPAEIKLESAARLWLYHSRRKVDFQLTRRIQPADNPLRDTPLAGADLHYAGYTLVTTLKLEPQLNAPVQIGIWNLLQLPQPGTMLIPLQQSAQPQVLFGSPAQEDLTLEPNLVRWKMSGGETDAKIGLKAPPLTGRVGYLRQNAEAGLWDLVVRQFAVNPQGNYVDALWSDPHEKGWVFQACCVCNVEHFNELEYHVHAVISLPGSNFSRDESTVWAFRGSAEAIDQAARELLGVTPG
jgi:hypothetical protein